MSIERICNCGEAEGIRINFADCSAEWDFHSKEYKCNVCKAKERKEQPVKTGVLDYFPDAIRAVAHCSFVGNEQHNPGTDLHWDRSKSGDELDALTRHLLDAGTTDSDGIRHSTKVAWRALANLQKEIERECQEDYEEELLEKISEDEKDLSQYMYDGEECDGLLGSHPLCCTDYCPCKEEEIEKRMDIIGRNGNTGEHYDVISGTEAAYVTRIKDATVTVNRSISDYPESNQTSTIEDIEVEYEIQTKEGKENNKQQEK